MAVVGGDEPIEKLVHHLDLNVGRLEHVRAIHLLKLLVPFALPPINIPVLFQFLFNHVIGFLDDR